MFNSYNPQGSLDRINSHIAELERMKSQLTQQQQQIPNLTQNFQISPNQGGMKYAESQEQVGETSGQYPDKVLLITMDGHITCSKYGIVYDSFDCRDRIVEDAWIVK